MVFILWGSSAIKKEKIIDTGKGWYMEDSFIDIIALHEIEPKFLQDLANAKLYKIIKKNGK